MMHEHHKVQLSRDPVLGASGDFFSANTTGELSLKTMETKVNFLSHTVIYI